MNTIYVPKGAAKEYGDYSLNIYTGCPHRCWYCFAPGVLHRDRNTFHTDVRPREGIVEATEGYLKSTKMTGKTVHLCFTCDPYPTGHDSSATREIVNNPRLKTQACVKISLRRPVSEDVRYRAEARHAAHPGAFY